MHILVVSQYFWPENFRINDLVRELIARGHKVTVLTGIPNYPSGKVLDEYRRSRSSFSYFEEAHIYRVPMLPRGTGNLQLVLNYLSFVFGGIFWGPWYLRGIKTDVIFVYEPSPITVGLPAILLGKLKRAPVVFWVLDLWPETLSSLGIVRSQQLINCISYMVRFIYNHCTVILGQSKSFLNKIKDYCDDKKKIYYFPNWADDPNKIIKIKPAAEIPLSANHFNIVLTGNIGEAQDMPAVLDAAEFLRKKINVRWIIVGSGRKARWLEAEIIKRGLRDIILLPGHFPSERMPSFYAHADALLVSLKKDPVFSLTIPGRLQNYLMIGLPLLGMLDGEGANIIKNAEAGFSCDSGDSLGLGYAILKLVAMSKKERAQLGKNAMEYGAREFSKSNLMNQLEAFLKEAITISNANAGKSGVR